MILYNNYQFYGTLTLQSDLDKLCNWAKEWLLRFNISKCKHLKYGTITSPYRSKNLIGSVVANVNVQH